MKTFGTGLVAAMIMVVALVLAPATAAAYTGPDQWEQPAREHVSAAAFSPDGRLLLTGYSFA